jgi:hypothetical protein
MLRTTTCLAVLAISGAAACADEPAAVLPPPVVFEGFGLESFSGRGSVAAALRGVRTEAAYGPPPLKLFVAGRPATVPAGTPLPIAAEVRSRIEGFDVAAGFSARPERIEDGPTRWTGRIGLSQEHEAGLERIEVRTSVDQRQRSSRLRVEVGPRLERRLPRGMRFFIDGKAEAQAVWSDETGGWALPGTPAAGGLGAVGVMARTGIQR